MATDPVDDVIENVLPRYYHTAYEFPKQFHDDFGQIVCALQTDSIRRRAQLIHHLRVSSWIPLRHARSGEVSLAFPDSRTYLPTQKLKGLFRGNPKIYFVDLSRRCTRDEKSEAALIEVGVGNYLQRTETDCNLSAAELRRIRRQAGLEGCDAPVLTDYEIVGLEYLVDSISQRGAGWRERSFLLWDCLHDALRYRGFDFFYARYRWVGGEGYREVCFPAAFVRLLRESAWLPGKDHKPKRPRELTFADLPEKFRRIARQVLVQLLRLKPSNTLGANAKDTIEVEILRYRDWKPNAPAKKSRSATRPKKGKITAKAVQHMALSKSAATKSRRSVGARVTDARRSAKRKR